jgi:TPR repeat protein
MPPKISIEQKKIAVNPNLLGHQDYMKAAQFHKKGGEKNLKKAAALYRLASGKGHSISQYNLGIMYEFGNGINQDKNEAFRLYKLAAGHGHREAQYSVGYCYDGGIGVQQDPYEAARWYESAAKQGHHEAQFNLGNLCKAGRGIKKDLRAAMKWYQLAADGGIAVDKTMLNLINMELAATGTGRRKRGAEANSLKELAESGCAQAQAKYAYSLLKIKGRGVQKNQEQAVRWYTAAAEQGNSIAQYNLAILYGNGIVVAKNVNEAFRLYKLAAEQGDENAQYNLAICYRDAIGTLRDEKLATDWCTAAAKQGHALAQTNLAICYWEGQSVDKDFHQAIEWFYAAAAQGQPQALVNLGRAYYNSGRFEEAMATWQKGADQGFFTLKLCVIMCYLRGVGVIENWPYAEKLYAQAIKDFSNITLTEEDKKNLETIKVEIKSRRTFKIRPRWELPQEKLADELTEYYRGTFRPIVRKPASALPVGAPLMSKVPMILPAPLPIRVPSVPKAPILPAPFVFEPVGEKMVPLEAPAKAWPSTEPNFIYSLGKDVYPFYLTIQDMDKDNPHQYAAIHPSVLKGRMPPEIFEEFKRELEKGLFARAKGEAGLKYIGQTQISFGKLVRSFTIYALKLKGRNGNWRGLCYLRPDNLIECHVVFEHKGTDYPGAIEKLKAIIYKEVLALGLI